MTSDIVAIVGINLLGLLSIALYLGRWIGKIETMLSHHGRTDTDARRDINRAFNWLRRLERRIGKTEHMLDIERAEENDDDDDEDNGE